MLTYDIAIDQKAIIVPARFHAQYTENENLWKFTVLISEVAENIYFSQNCPTVIPTIFATLGPVGKTCGLGP